MCRFSLYIVLSNWWGNEDIALSQKNNEGNNLLVLAAVVGCKPICETFIKRGIQVNLQLSSDDYGSALAATAARGNTEIVKFLVEKGAEVNLPLLSGSYRSALAAAVYWGWKGCAESLLDVGAKVNIRLEKGPHRTALQASRADVSREDRERVWDWRDEPSLKGRKLEWQNCFDVMVQ
jgi:hypothetical protein